jgi:putative toxin-antitoxin system antitoxin component (TIGR02293 family)
MEREKKIVTHAHEKFDPKKSIKRAQTSKGERSPVWTISVGENKHEEWQSKHDRIAIIRKGLPYSTVEVISRQSNIPIGRVLNFIGVAQTTYNKNKRAKILMSGRNSEAILLMAEVLKYGDLVFNHETEKFNRWLKKTNISIGNVTPESLFDTLSGIQVVRNCLNRLEHGNFA